MRAPSCQIEPRQQCRVGGSAECAVALRQDVAKGQRRIERQRAVERIGAINRLDLDQRGAPVLGTRHGAHGGGDARRGPALEPALQKARSSAPASRMAER